MGDSMVAKWVFWRAFWLVCSKGSSKELLLVWKKDLCWVAKKESKRAETRAASADASKALKWEKLSVVKKERRKDD